MCAIPMGVYQNRLQSKNFKYLFTQLRILINSLHDSVFTKKNMKTKCLMQTQHFPKLTKIVRNVALFNIFANHFKAWLSREQYLILLHSICYICCSG